MLSEKPCIAPISGTTNPVYLNNFLGAAEVRMSTNKLKEFEKGYSKIHLVGHRTDPFTESQIDR